jgi:uncharacterized protein YpmS
MKNKWSVISLAALNVLLLAAAIFFYLCTAQNNQNVNSFTDSFIYQDGDEDADLTTPTDQENGEADMQFSDDL